MSKETQLSSQPIAENQSRRRMLNSGPWFYKDLTIPQLTTSHHDGYWTRLFRIAVQNYMNISMAGDLAVEQLWLFWGTTERTKNRYYSWPHILDFRFLLLYCKRSRIYGSTMIQISPLTCTNIMATVNITVKPRWLFISDKKQWDETCETWPQRLDTTCLNLHNNHHHMFWSIIIHMTPDNL